LDEDTKRKQRIRITDAGGLSERDIERMVKEAERHQAEDEQARDWVALRNRAMNLVYSSDRLLEDASGSLTPVFRTRLTATLSELRKLLGGGVESSPGLRTTCDRLIDLLKEIEYVEEGQA